MERNEKVGRGIAVALLVLIFGFFLFPIGPIGGTGTWTGYHDGLNTEVRLIIHNEGWDSADTLGRRFSIEAAEAIAEEVAEREAAERKAVAREAAETGKYIYSWGYDINWYGNTGLLIDQSGQQWGRVELLNRRNAIRLTMDDTSTIMLSR